MMPTHRKIIESEYPSNSSLICTYCDPSKPPSINCFPTCILNSSDPSPPPSPPLSPPYADGYIFNTPPSRHHSSLSLPLKISLVILILTFSFFLLYTLYKFYTVWYRSRRRRATPPSPSPENQETSNGFVDHDVLDHPIWYIRTIGLQPSVISAITVVKYNKTDGLIEGVSCSVCLNDFQEDETLRLLPKCNHAFHVACIDTWLRSHTSCPLCRAGIVKSVSNNNNNNNNINNNNINNNNNNLEEVEESVTVLVTEDGDGEERDEDEQMSDVGIVGGSGFIRRSVSLNDYEACRVRSDVRINVNNYYSDRHDVQIQPVDGSLGFDLVKVDRTANNCP